MIVAGGNGRGGTRVPIMVLEQAGFEAAFNVLCSGRTYDFRPFMHFSHLHQDDFCRGGAILEQMEKDFIVLLKKIDEHGVTAWKEPRTSFWLPALDIWIPDLKYIHIVRDGRDIACKDIGRARKDHCLLAKDEYKDYENSEDIMMLIWKRSQQIAADYGQKMGSRYLRLRFEDIWEDRLAWCERIAEFVGLHDADLNQMASVISSKPKTIGAYKQAAPQKIDRMTELGHDMLLRFRYL